jgi:N6-L-threonylcarbamoyladenine synthase
VTGHNVRRNADFSFSGLKTAIRQLADTQDVNVPDVCASFQAAVIDILRDRTTRAMQMFRADFPAAPGRLVIAGGVAANQAIGTALAALADTEDFAITVPPPGLCTDNAAMIAWAGLERLSSGMPGDALSLSPRARWPLQGASSAV